MNLYDFLPIQPTQNSFYVVVTMKSWDGPSLLNMLSVPRLLMPCTYTKKVWNNGTSWESNKVPKFLVKSLREQGKESRPLVLICMIGGKAGVTFSRASKEGALGISRLGEVDAFPYFPAKLVHDL